MVAIWKEKPQREHSGRLNVCGRVPSRTREKNKIERRHFTANSDKSCKTCERMIICALDVQTYNDIAHRTGALLEMDHFPSSSNEENATEILVTRNCKTRKERVLKLDRSK